MKAVLSVPLRPLRFDAPGERAQLATRVGAAFTLPLLQDPGCRPPLLPPLAADTALVDAFSAFGSGDDLMTGVVSTCMSQDGIVPPANGVAISGEGGRAPGRAGIASELRG